MNIKMIHTQHILIGLTALLILLSACDTTDFENIGIDHNPALAINAEIFQGDSLINITISQSIGISDTIFYENLELDLESAELLLSTPDEGVLQGFQARQTSSFNGVSLPIWDFNYKDFIAGEEYSLSVNLAGFDPIISTITIPKKPVLTEVVLDRTESQDNFIRDRFEITINDPAEEENFYYIRAIRSFEESGFVFQRKYRFFDLPSNPIDESFLENVVSVISDREFNGRERKLIVFGEKRNQEDLSVEFQLFQITKAHFDYIQNFDRANTDSPFAEPIILNSNIEGGHGIFAVTSEPDVVIFN